MHDNAKFATSTRKRIHAVAHTLTTTLQEQLSTYKRQNALNAPQPIPTTASLAASGPVARKDDRGLDTSLVDTNYIPSSKNTLSTKVHAIRISVVLPHTRRAYPVEDLGTMCTSVSLIGIPTGDKP